MNGKQYLQPGLSDTLALLPLVKRQVFCEGDRLKMDKHKAWATTIVAPKSVGSSTTLSLIFLASTRFEFSHVLGWLSAWKIKQKYYEEKIFNSNLCPTPWMTGLTYVDQSFAVGILVYFCWPQHWTWAIPQKSTQRLGSSWQVWTFVYLVIGSYYGSWHHVIWVCGAKMKSDWTVASGTSLIPARW